MDEWPMPNIGDLRREFDALKKTHTVCPLPAWDMDGSFILPKEYASKLANATVRLNCALKGWDFAKDRKTTFSFTVREMFVIARSNATASPLKRRVTSDTTESASPVKKGKLTV
jgi:hypothetical protein